MKDAALSKPPQIEQPQSAREACTLYRITGAHPTISDLEVGYATRGAELIACDLKRELAVATHDREHRAEEAWTDQREDRRAPWWQFWR